MATPQGKDELIAFARAHRDAWELVLATLGISQAEYDELASLVDLSEQHRAAALSAIDASRSAVIIQDDTLAELRKTLGGLITTITATAKKSSDPASIWAAAELPVPKTPTELKTPPAPISVTGQINASGGVDLAWKNPSKNAFIGATYFIVERSLKVNNTSEDFTYVASPADRKFTDETIPPGYDSATYRVSATRNNKTSQPATVIVNFGVGGSGTAANASPTVREAA